MIIQTVAFIVGLILSILLVIGVIFFIEPNEMESLCAMMLFVFIGVITFLCFIVPNKSTRIYEDRYDIYTIADNYKDYDCDFKIETIDNPNTIDYICYEEYIFGRKKMILGTNNIDKYKDISYFKSLDSEKELFKEYIK